MEISSTNENAGKFHLIRSTGEGIGKPILVFIEGYHKVKIRLRLEIVKLESTLNEVFVVYQNSKY